MAIQAPIVELRIGFSCGAAHQDSIAQRRKIGNARPSTSQALGLRISTYSAGLYASSRGRFSASSVKVIPSYLSWIFNGSKKEGEQVTTKCTITEDKKDMQLDAIDNPREEKKRTGKESKKDEVVKKNEKPVNNLDNSNERKQRKSTSTENKKQKDDNEYEINIRSDVVLPSEIEVTFEDVGALEETKKLIQELVILPLKRPELFMGGLLKPCRGILLFGPPGTGKTMLAKAIAKESGANFISVSLSSIFCKWVGESNKNVKALFTLAAKVAPTVIFVDEIDSLLGRRTSDEHDSTSRKVKNEFMSLWDGLRTEAGKHVVVLGATNRPFDLDDAIIRRFERRILLDLPSKSSRGSILKKILAEENAENMDFEELALMTEGYTGSDLKNLCVTAAYYPLRELLEEEGRCTEMNQNTQQKPVLRPLNMDDIRQAKTQIAASFSADGSIMKELQEWNNNFGEGGSRNKR